MERQTGREEGVALLALSQGLDGLTIPRGPSAEAFQALAVFGVRARRLTSAIYTLLDEDLDLEAEMLGRILMETTVTLQWLAKDFSRRIPSWRLDDARRRISWDNAYAQAHDGRGMMGKSARASVEALRDRLEAGGAEKFPEFWERCVEIEPRWHVLLYRGASHGAVHPSAMALQKFIANIDSEGAHVRADAPETLGDEYPYEMPALWLQITLDVLSRVAPRSFPWREQLDALGARLAAAIESRGEGGEPDEP